MNSNSCSVNVAFRVQVCIHSPPGFTVNILLNIHSLDISSFASEESDLGGDDCEEADSKSSVQLMSDTSESKFRFWRC